MTLQTRSTARHINRRPPLRRLASVALTAALTAVGAGAAAPSVAEPVTRERAAAVGAPRDVEARVHGESVRLSWDRPARTGESAVQRYEVRYRLGAAGDWSATRATEERTIAVRRLVGGTRTGFQVRARTKTRTGAWSRTITALPLSEPDAVRQVRVDPRDHAVRLTWLPPIEDGGRPVTRYEVQYRRTGTGAWRSTVRSSAAATITGLRNGTRYSFFVRAQNGMGNGHWASVTRANAGERVVAAPATAVSLPVVPQVTTAEQPPAAPATAPQQVQASVHAEQPTAGAAVDAVAAPGQEVGAADPRAADLAPPASNGPAESTPAAPVESAPAAPVESEPSVPPAPPGQVAEVVATVITTAVQLDWAAPAGAPVTSYEVRFRRADETSWSTRTASAPQLVVGDLIDGTDYDFAVRAVGEGPGPWSPTVRARPVHTPGAPAAPTVRFTGRDLEVEAAWTPSTATVAGETITGWDVRSRTRQGGWQVVTVYGAAAEKLGGLDPTPGFFHEFSVRARSTTDFGAWSPSTELYVPVLTQPVVSVDTEGAAPVASRDTYLAAAFALDPNGSLDASGASYPMVAGAAEIKGRGNSTWYAAKKPYRLKLATKASLLGMPANKNWVLLANAYDHSLLRNDTALYLGGKTSLAWTPRTRYVEVLLNGDYLGLYQLAEQVRIDPGRIDIKAMSAKDISGKALTGGYQLERDGRWNASEEAGFTSVMSQPIVIKDPEVPAAEQAAYIERYFDDFERALQSEDRGDPAKGYAKYIDVESFVDWYVVEEYVQNVDANFASTDLYKPREGLLKMGPLWDFDLSLGGDSRLDGKRQQWYVKNESWWPEFFKDPTFETKVEHRWHSLRTSLTDVERHVERTQDLIATAAQGDSARWGEYADHDGQVDQVLGFLQERGAWLDSKWGTTD